MPRSEDKPKYIDGIGWRYETLHNMHRRMQGHDYRERCIYMITIATEGRSQLLGNLRWPQNKPEEAWVEPTALGLEVERCWQFIPVYYPGVVPLALQLMPDHMHGLLFVTSEQKSHLGQIVNGFKVGCNRAYRRLMYSEAVPQKTEQAVPQKTEQAVSQKTEQAVPQKTEQAVPRTAQQTKHPEHGMLFETGYQDSILMGKDQLDRMFQYIADNPKRLAIKKVNPVLFRVVRELKVGDLTFAAIGNGWLLQRADRLQVRCHNNTTPENLELIRRQKEYLLGRARDGGVIVSPCISAGEKEIARAALDAGVPLIVILENGFPPMYKPPGRYFEACAKGLLLMLAPWPYHMERRTITRQQCLALNDIAYRMSTEPWTQEMESRLKLMKGE